MVVSFARPPVAPPPNGAITISRKPPKETSSPGLLACPRCDAQLRRGYFEPECLRCGYVDYRHTAPIGSTKSIISSGTRYVLRYVGEFSGLCDVLTHVQLLRIRNRVAYDVNCPFCGVLMTQTSLSGKRREVREERYKCDAGHRVSLTPSRNGGLGWK